MRKLSMLLVTLVLMAPGYVQAAESGEPRDQRYPVTLTPQEALEQKAQMRNSLVALRGILAALAEKDFVAVEKAMPDLGHSGSPSAQKVATTTVYQKLEGQFHSQVDKVAAAARSHDVDKVLRELSATMGNCQACHAALRQEVVPAEPENTPLPK